jgi:hypothetical protein
LRKNGIIVSPVETNEDLPSGTAQRINLKSNIDSSNNVRGNAVEIVLCDAAGNILKDSNEKAIKCAISYEGTKGKNGEKEYTSGKFLFNGVDLNSLNTAVNDVNTGLVKKVGDLETTVRDSDSGLVKDVNDNKTDITNLKGLSKISFYTGTNTSEVKAVKTDYTLESIVINTDDDLSAANFIGTVEFNGHRVNGHINYAPSGNKNGNGARNGIYYDSTSKRIIVDIILCNETAISWTFGAGEIRVKVLAIY